MSSELSKQQTNSSSSSSGLNVLKHHVDAYNSVVINDECTMGAKILKSVFEFERTLWFSLGEWRRAGRKGVWLKIGAEKSEYIPAAIRCGFMFHHAEPEVLHMTAWLSSTHKNKLPPSALHFVGVAGFVVNSKKEVLVIQEKSGPSANLKGFWKLPGGLVDKFEDICDAACREVREETGIETSFSRIASIQEIHHVGNAGPAREGTSDLYCVCVLTLTREDQKIVKCEDEIADARWMPLEEFLKLSYIARPNTVFNKAFHEAALVALGSSPGFAMSHLDLGFAPIKNRVYSANQVNLSKL